MLEFILSSLLSGINVLSPIPAKRAARGIACASSPIPKNKNSPNKMNKNSVSIERNLNWMFFSFSLTKPIVNKKRITREIRVKVMFSPE